MRLARFSREGKEFFSIVDGSTLYEVEDGDLFSGTITKGPAIGSVDKFKILAPCAPTKIVAIGLNYRAHAAEFDKKLPEEPMLFLKPSTAVIGHNGEIIYPSHMSRRVDYEGELAVVIGRRASHIRPDEAPDYILGYTCFNDVTARDLQARDVQYTRAKGFDTFAAFGPWIETELDPLDVRIRTYLNNEKRQDARTWDMIFDVFELTSFVSRVMTLVPGDVIATGTPSGVGKMKPGDVVEVTIDGIGSLVNTVRAMEP